VNQCYRGGPCLFGEPVAVDRGSFWDYYDRASRSYVFLRCRLNQKYYTPSLLQIEEADKYNSGLSTETYETPDLQLADQNGRWMTRSEDPDCYRWPADDEPRACGKCELICEIREDARYLNEDGTCPFPDAPPEPAYWKVNDEDKPCQDFLHPLLLQDLDAINRRKRRAAKAKIWSYLKEPKWMHALINSGDRMIDVWRRNYQPVAFYYRSFDTIKLYVKNLPSEAKKNKHLLNRIRDNIRKSPSFQQLLGSWEEEAKLEELEGYIGKLMKNDI
jgi:hypothetical protein